MGSGWLWGHLGPQADQLLTFLPRGHLHRLGPTTAPQEPNRKTLRGMGQELAWHKSAANSATASVFCETPATWRPRPWSGLSCHSSREHV